MKQASFWKSSQEELKGEAASSYMASKLQGGSLGGH
jgi:hypothetical protein